MFYGSNEYSRVEETMLGIKDYTQSNILAETKAKILISYCMVTLHFN